MLKFSRLTITNLGLRLAIALGLLASSSTSAQTNFALLTGDGAWTWFNDPRALFNNGLLYFSYNRAADGGAVLSTLDLQNGQVTNLWTSTRTLVDDHYVPGFVVKQDGTMLAVYSRHQNDQSFMYRLSTGTNPATASGWGAEHTNTTGTTVSSGMTYANPFQLAAENGRLYEFSRYLNYNPNVFVSTNGGTNWSNPTILILTGSGSTRPYVKYCSDYNSRIDFLYTDAHPDNYTNSLYHMYYQGGAFYRTDGSFLTNFAGLPILHDQGQRGSVVYQYSDAPQTDPNQWIPSARAWCWEIAYQTNGAPVCVFQGKVDNVTGTNWYDARIYYYYASWTGTNWQKQFIAQAGRPLYDGQPDYGGGMSLDPQNPGTIYISTDAASPFDLTTTTNVLLGAHYQIWKGVTTNGGLTFAWQPITGNSTADNLRPYIPRRFGGEPCVLWFRGTYTSYTSFSTQVVGLFTTQVPQTNAASGAWNTDADGVWSDSTKWLDDIVASGAGNTADFSTVITTSDRTVTLDTSRSLGTLKFGDPGGTNNWQLIPGGGGVLTLDTGTSASPAIAVTNTATIQAVLAGTNGFTKSGPGTLILAASNAMSGNVNLDSGSTTANDGAVCVASSAALANVASPINFRNNSGPNAVGSLQLNGAAGGITVTQSFSTTCRNNHIVPTFENLAGTNLLAGANFCQVGGTNVIYQADAGSWLLVTAPMQYVGTLTAARTFTFTGAGNVTVSGAILAATNAAPIGVLKTGAGMLTLSGVNTYTNGTTVSGGALLVNGSLTNGLVTVTGGTLGGGGFIRGPVTIQSGGTLSPGAVIGTTSVLTISNSLNLSGMALMALNPGAGTNDQVRGLASVTYGGTLSLTNLSGVFSTNNAFKLFAAAGYSGAFTALAPAIPAPGFAWNTNTLATDGTLRVLQTVSQTPVSLMALLTGGLLTLSWPADHTGWRLQVQTNALADGLTGNWVNLAGSSATNQVIIPIAPNNGTVFYRMIFP